MLPHGSKHMQLACPFVIINGPVLRGCGVKGRSLCVQVQMRSGDTSRALCTVHTHVRRPAALVSRVRAFDCAKAVRFLCTPHTVDSIDTCPPVHALCVRPLHTASSCASRTSFMPIFTHCQQAGAVSCPPSRFLNENVYWLHVATGSHAPSQL